MENLENPINMENEQDQFFKFVPKNETQLYHFEKKNVNALYNVILNFIAG